jgi:hypothetical protein
MIMAAMIAITAQAPITPRRRCSPPAPCRTPGCRRRPRPQPLEPRDPHVVVAHDLQHRRPGEPGQHADREDGQPPVIYGFGTLPLRLANTPLTQLTGCHNVATGQLLHQRRRK